MIDWQAWPAELALSEQEEAVLADPQRLPYASFPRWVQPGDVAPALPRLYGQAHLLPALVGQPIWVYGIRQGQRGRLLSGAEATCRFPSYLPHSDSPQGSMGAGR